MRLILLRFPSNHPSTRAQLTEWEARRLVRTHLKLRIAWCKNHSCVQDTDWEWNSDHWSDDHWNTEYDQLVSSHLMISWPSASCCPANEMVVRSEGENLALLPFFPLLRFPGFPRYNVSFIFFLAMLSSFVLFGLFRVLLTKSKFACLDGVFFILIFPFSLSLLCCLQIFLWFLLASWPSSNNWSCWSSLM